MIPTKVVNKSLIFLVGLLIAFGVYYYLNVQGQLRRAREQEQKNIKKEKDARQKSLDSLNILYAEEISEYKEQISTLSDQAERLKRSIRYYETRPDYDLDFLSAVDVISRAEYRSDQ